MAKTFIHSSAIVKTKNIGEGSYIGPFCNITERVVIEKNCKLIGWVSIGSAGQFKNPPKDCGNSVIIESGTEIREFVTINAPMDEITKVGRDSLLMTTCHVSHDTVLGHDVVLASGAHIAGYANVGNYCYIGLNASMHQFAKLGDYSIIGGNSFFKGESPMGITWAGVPARPIKVNLINIEKNVKKEERQSIIIIAEQFIKGQL